MKKLTPVFLTGLLLCLVCENTYASRRLKILPEATYSCQTNFLQGEFDKYPHLNVIQRGCSESNTTYVYVNEHPIRDRMIGCIHNGKRMLLSQGYQYPLVMHFSYETNALIWQGLKREKGLFFKHHLLKFSPDDNRNTVIKIPDGFMDLTFNNDCEPIAGLFMSGKKVSFRVKTSAGWREVASTSPYMSLSCCFKYSGNKLFFAEPYLYANKTHLKRIDLNDKSLLQGVKDAGKVYMIGNGLDDVHFASELLVRNDNHILRASAMGNKCGIIPFTDAFLPDTIAWRVSPLIEGLLNKIAIPKLQQKVGHRNFDLVDICARVNGPMLLTIVLEDGRDTCFNFDTTNFELKTERNEISDFRCSFDTTLYEISAEDGLKLPSYLTRPKNHNAEQPLILNIHGGPPIKDAWDLDHITRLFVLSGCSVLRVNYRGSTSSPELYKKGEGQWSDEMQKDISSAVQWALDRHIVRPENVGFYGHSWGGFAAYLQSTGRFPVKGYPRFRFSAVVAGAGPSDFSLLIDNTLNENGPYFPEYICQLKSICPDIDIRTLSLSKSQRNRLRKESPINFASDINVPLLILHGENDIRVPVEHSKLMSDALSKVGVKHTVALFNDDHGISKPGNTRSMYAVMAAFFKQNLTNFDAEPFEFTDFYRAKGMKIARGGNLIPDLASAHRNFRNIAYWMTHIPRQQWLHEATKSGFMALLHE